MVTSLSAYPQFVPLQDPGIPGKPLQVNENVPINGSPYLKDSWIYGNVRIRNGKMHNNLPIKYNVYTDRLEFRHGDGIFETEPSVVVEFSFLENNDTIIFRNGFSGIAGYKQTAYFQILYKKKWTWLKKTACKIITDPGSSYGSSKNKTFNKEDFYFLLKNDGGYHQFKKTKKSLLKTFADHHKEIEAFIENNDINFQNEGDFIMVLSFIDQIQP